MASAPVADHYSVARIEIVANSYFDWPFVIMNVLATVIACYGLLANSAAVVIGAMILALLLGPISGVALALVDGNSGLLRKALITEIGGVLLVLATSFVLGLLHRDIPLTPEIMSRTAPDFFELMIALAGGAAGAYASISPRLSVAFIGVALATALVPPLACCGLLFARGEFDLAGGAFLLAFVNIVAIQGAASFVMWISGIARGRPGRLLMPNVISVGVLLVLTAVLAFNFHRLVGKMLFEATVTRDLRHELANYPGTFLTDTRFTRLDGFNVTIVRAVVRGPQELSAKDVGKLEDSLPQPADGTRLELRLRRIHTTVMTRQGQLFTTGDPDKSD